MSKKSKDYSENKEESKAKSPQAGDAKSAEEAALSKLPPDVQEKLKGIKVKLEKFQKKALEKFDKYIVGIALLPPQKPMQQPGMPQMPLMTGQAPQQDAAPQPENKDQINVLVLVDD